LAEYFAHYNTARPHQSLGYETPDHVYRTTSGGGAKIVDKYCEKEKAHPEIKAKKETKNRGSAVPLLEEGYPLKLDVLLS
jgi:putative transposase